MTTASTPDGTLAPTWQSWRDWLLSSLFAVFLISLVAAHLPPRLMKIVVFPIGFSIVCGIAIGKCAEFAGARPSHPSRLQWLCVVCLLLAGFAHMYWIVFSRHLDEAREVIAEKNAERNETEQIINSLRSQGHELDEAGVTAMLQPPAILPNFIDYLSLRLQSDHIPNFIKVTPWPIVIFVLEITVAVVIGAWFAFDKTSNPQPTAHPPDATTS